MKLPSVFVLGDSISIHYGPYLQKFLEGFFHYARKEGVAEGYKNLDEPTGANAGDSSMVLRYLQSNQARDEIGHVNYLFFNCGLHDIKTDPVTGVKQVSQVQYESNLRSIVSKARQFTQNVIWINSTPIDEKIHNKIRQDFYRFSKDCVEYNNTANRVMKENNVPIINLYDFTLNCGHDLYIDHAHFSETVRQKQAKFISDYLLQLIKG